MTKNCLRTEDRWFSSLLINQGPLSLALRLIESNTDYSENRELLELKRKARKKRKEGLLSLSLSFSCWCSSSTEEEPAQRGLLWRKMVAFIGWESSLLLSSCIKKGFKLEVGETEWGAPFQKLKNNSQRAPRIAKRISLHKLARIAPVLSPTVFDVFLMTLADF